MHTRRAYTVLLFISIYINKYIYIYIGMQICKMINMCTKNLWGALNERVKKKTQKKYAKTRKETRRLRIIGAASIGLER